MVDPGATADDIRAEVFDSFTTRIEESDIEEEVAEMIRDSVLAEDPPHEFSGQLLDVDSEDNGT